MLTTWYDLNRAFPFPAFRRDLESLFEALDRSGNATDSALELSLWDNEDALVVTAAVPGVAGDDLELTLHDNVLTISGKREVTVDEGVRALRRERGSLTFQRSLTLPVRVDADKVSADLNDGVLVVRMEKADEARPRRIAIA